MEFLKRNPMNNILRSASSLVVSKGISVRPFVRLSVRPSVRPSVRSCVRPFVRLGEEENDLKFVGSVLKRASNPRVRQRKEASFGSSKSYPALFDASLPLTGQTLDK